MPHPALERATGVPTRHPPVFLTALWKTVFAFLLLLSSAARAQLGIELHGEPLALDSACSDSFIRHPLDHITRARGSEVRFYDSNGAGVAAGDLDGDNDLDLALANLEGPNTIFWNEGNLVFRREMLSPGGSRAVNAVDVDGDGRLDLVFTQGLGALSFWHNEGGSFRRAALRGVHTPAYAMAWADLNGDNDLDLVTASYDALLEKEQGNAFLFSAGAGVMIYRQQEGRFVGERLSRTSQSLALALLDLDDDGRLDLLVGNDFLLGDAAWLNTSAGWQQVDVFPTTSQNTMSFAVGDIDNDGNLELFATDMKPLAEKRTSPEWQPILEMMASKRPPAGDPQTAENVLQERSADGSFTNTAPRWGIAASGWSWSAAFGDLDRDGFLDLYVVNGMIAADILSYLPGNELVEQNQAFRNDGEGRFLPAPEWELGSTASGRGMIMADLDNDGDLDIVVNNLEKPATLFENRLCGGSSLELELRWPESGNSVALGATAFLNTSMGRLRRDVRVGGGYLSGNPSRLHFGFPTGSELRSLEIHWPDGVVTVLEHPTADSLLTLTREAP